MQFSQDAGRPVFTSEFRGPGIAPEHRVQDDLSMGFHAESLLLRVDDLQTRLESSERAWVREDLAALTLDICESVAPILQISRLETAFGDDAQLDAGALRQAVDLLKAIPSDDYDMPCSAEFSAVARFEALDHVVKSAEEAVSLSELELALRLQLLGDAQFDGLLLALRGHDEDVRRRLRDDVRRKMAMLDDAQARALLARYQSETDADLDVRIELRADILSAADCKVSSGDEARDKAADYIVVHRPRLERAMLESGRNYFPADFLGIARILSWTSGRKSDLKRGDVDVVTSASRVSACWGSTLAAKDRRAALASALGVHPDGYIVAGRGATQALSMLGQTVPTPRALVSELKKLLLLAVAASADSPVELALRGYKSGAEIMAKESREQFISQDEEWLQRHVCRFLAERGHHSFGTKFARNEVDLRAADRAGALVIEVKKVTDDAPSPAVVRKWFSQLHSYMDQELLRNRGVLLIFNFSSTPVLAPPTLLNGRILMVVLNLCLETASTRKSSIVIEESSDPDQFVRVFRNGS